MNYNYLRYFSVLAQVENYTLAAARLGISQPSLSNAIHHLEDDLGGIRLFEKVGRNIRLTEEGRYFQEKVESSLRGLHSATMTLRNSKVSAPVLISIGFVSGTLDGAAAGEVAQHIQRNERIRFQLTEGAADKLLDLVRQEKLDMAIVDTTSRDRSLHFRRLGQRNLCVALPAGHPLADQEFLLPQQIAREKQVAINHNMEHSFDQWASGETNDVPVVCTVNTARAALELVAAGVGIAVVAESCAENREDVRFVPLRNRHSHRYSCTRQTRQR